MVQYTRETLYEEVWNSTSSGLFAVLLLTILKAQPGVEPQVQ